MKRFNRQIIGNREFEMECKQKTTYIFHFIFPILRLNTYGFLFSFLLLSSCSNAQEDRVIYTSPVSIRTSNSTNSQKVIVTQGDLNNYLSSRKITGDTTGKTKDYLQLIIYAKRNVLINTASTYEKALLTAEENVRIRGLVDKVLVVKHERKMYLLKDGKTVQTFPIALGPNPIGQKEYEGDGKTPEGTYTLDWQKWNSSTLHSFHISYPNKIDSARAKQKGLIPGSNIMIHGTSKGIKKKKDWTNGCIALTNTDMIAFRKIVFQDTAIEIIK